MANHSVVDDDPREVEECLLEIEQKAALLRFLASSATMSGQPPDTAALGGMEDVCREMQELARTIRRSLSPDVLTTPMHRVTD